jgi:hypothetical protein
VPHWRRFSSEVLIVIAVILIVAAVVLTIVRK